MRLDRHLVIHGSLEFAVSIAQGLEEHGILNACSKMVISQGYTAIYLPNCTASFSRRSSGIHVWEVNQTWTNNVREFRKCCDSNGAKFNVLIKNWRRPRSIFKITDRGRPRVERLLNQYAGIAENGDALFPDVRIFEDIAGSLGHLATEVVKTDDVGIF